jgi:hypothetical protein
MKKSIILLIVFAFVIISCDDNNENANPDPQTSITQSKWKVSLFKDDTRDETSHFQNYEFEFLADGTVKATGSGTVILGTWSVQSSSSGQKFILNFGTATPFDELNDDWHILSNTSMELKLQDVSGGDGHLEYLSFVKI